MDRLRVEELPDRYGPLAVLYTTDEKPVFKNNQEEVTRGAADRLAELCMSKVCSTPPSR
jgi:hypothetical protein